MMTTSSENQIAAAWIEYMSVSDEDEIVPNDAALVFDVLYNLVRPDPEKAWRIVQIMWKMDSSNDRLAIIAAGPVEDLLAVHGPRFIDRIELLAKQEPIFKKMLGAVWGKNTISSDIWKRLKAVAGPSF